MVHNLLEKARLKNLIISLLSIRKSNPKITFGSEVISSEVQHHLKMLHIAADTVREHLKSLLPPCLVPV